jgi:colicin import membrane protein
MQRANQTTMLKSYEKEISLKAGAYAIAVHLALLGGLLISFNWKAAHPVLNVAEVELWESIPNSAPPPPLIQPKVEPKIEPAPVVKDVPEPKPEAKVEEPKVDIALEEKEELVQRKLEEKAEKLNKERLAAIQADTLKDEKRDSEKQLNDKKAKDELKKLQQELSAEGDQQALAAKASANAGIIDEYKRKIQDKIKGNVNNELCGDGKPVLKFKIDLLPSGELSGSPKLTKTSGLEACDDAVERAIMASQPLPLPDDVALKSQFRNLNLTFTPNN